MKFVKTASEKDFVFIARGFIIDTFAASACPHMTFPTGNTPKPLYASFDPKGDLAGLSWQFSQLDEYTGLKAGDPRNFGDWLRRDLLDPLYLPEKNRLMFDPYATDFDAELLRYRTEFAKRGALDVAFLGVGATGHLGLNDPPATPLDETRIVPIEGKSYEGNLDYWTGDEYSHLPPLPLSLTGYTLGMKEILEAQHVVVMLRNKPALLERIEQTIKPDRNFPVSLLRAHKNTTILSLG